MVAERVGAAALRQARDAIGTFNPLAERITGWTETDCEAFIGRIRGDLPHHVGGTWMMTLS